MRERMRKEGKFERGDWWWLLNRAWNCFISWCQHWAQGSKTTNKIKINSKIGLPNQKITNKKAMNCRIRKQRGMSSSEPQLCGEQKHN